MFTPLDECAISNENCMAASIARGRGLLRTDNFMRDVNERLSYLLRPGGFITLWASGGKRNVTVWRPSVCPSVRLSVCPVFFLILIG